MNAHGIQTQTRVVAGMAAVPSVDPTKFRQMASDVFAKLKLALVRSDFNAFKALFPGDAAEDVVRGMYNGAPHGGQAALIAMTELTVYENTAYGGVKHMQVDTVIAFEQVAADKVHIVMFGRL